MVGVDLLQRDEPYYIPGYAGYSPQHIFLCGETYGGLSNRLLTDPSISHAKKLALVDRHKGHEVVRPTKADVALVNSRSERTDQAYGNPVLSSYAGFVPNQADVRDKPYEIIAVEGVANFERQRLKKRDSLERLRTTIELQSGSRQPKNLEERLLLRSKFKLPLIAVHPERIGLPGAGSTVDERYERPKDYHASPYFMENRNPEKFFINGYTGYAPYRHVHVGKVWRKMTNHDTAIMPTYTGHVPGEKDTVGRTRGYCSKFAHQFIKENLFKLELSACKMPK
ncbi:hypothetical protein QAD02_017081 [Eretmocerus hayati]|uniref:Uncharacterized protein n=1 Tax=Eretmocerus hayati TaxID=131215 RepID=A0ACC2PCD6_9HYME|nr:hypothetical protein QAD02_017081 [Eretmocerus hayati]